MHSSSEDLNSREARWRELSNKQLLGHLTLLELTELESSLENHREARDIYVFACKVDTALRGVSSDELPKSRGFRGLAFLQRFVIAAVLALVATFTWCFLKPGKTIAYLATATNAKWVSQSFERGQGLRSGQRIEILSGEVEVRFKTGATTRLNGPAMFEIESENSGYLIAGDAFSTAETPESQGFSIHTRNATFIDRGTKFFTRAGLDGSSHVEVTTGKVEVSLHGQGQMQRLNSGSSLGIEPGEVPILVRIERGEETPEFRFPTIAPPSSNDFADSSLGIAKASIIKGELSYHSSNRLADSGLIDKLLDGQAQRNQDSPNDSVFFKNSAKGTFLIDLGSPTDILRINSYTWHQNYTAPNVRYRAVQRFTLWGFSGSSPNTDIDSLAHNGWVRIARVNSDEFFEVSTPDERPAQQACSISAAKGSLGTFRYLLFDVQPTPVTGQVRALNHTFYGEIDVYAAQ